MAPLPRPGPWWWRHHPGWDRAARGLGRVESRPGGRRPASRRFTSRLRQAVLSSVMAASTTALTRVTAPSLGCANLPPARGAADGPPRPVPRRASSAAARQRGGTAARRHGSAAARQRGGTAARRHGSAAARQRGGTGARGHGGAGWGRSARAGPVPMRAGLGPRCALTAPAAGLLRRGLLAGATCALASATSPWPGLGGRRAKFQPRRLALRTVPIYL